MPEDDAYAADLADLDSTQVPDDAPFGDCEDPFRFHDAVGLWNCMDNATAQGAFLVDARAEFEPAIADFKTCFPTYTCASKWRWHKVKSPTLAHFESIVDILFMFFAIWARIGMGYVHNDQWIPTPLFRQHDAAGGSVEERSAGYFCYLCPDNASVYIELRTTNIAQCINSFFRLIDILGFYTKSSPFYIAPPCNEGKLVTMLTNKICALVYVVKHAGYSMAAIPTQSWNTFGIGPWNVDCPNPIRDWSTAPLIRCSDPDIDKPPVNDNGRRFPLTSEGCDKFLHCHSLCNKFLYQFATRQRHLPKDEARKWYCRMAVALFHKFCPNFTCLVGTQVMQRVARDHVVGVEPDDPRPAAYDVDFKSHINTDEEEAFGHNIFALSSVLHSYITGILALVGMAGCGKSTLVDMLTMLIGGHKRVTVLDKQAATGAFSSSMIQRWAGPGLFVVEDTENTPAALPPSIVAVFTGKKRTNINGSFNQRRKHLPERLLVARSTPVVMCANYPPSPVDGGSIESTIVQAIIHNAGAGVERRVIVATPGTSPTAGGTCGVTSHPFEEDTLLDAENANCELAFLVVLFTAFGLVGDALARPDTGMISPTNELAKTLFNDWIARSRNPTGHCTQVVRNLLVHTDAIIFNSLGRSLVMRQGVDCKTLRDSFFDATRTLLDKDPHSAELFRSTCANCKYCRMAFTCDDTSADAILAYYNSCANVNRGMIIRPCPKNADTHCYRSIVRESIYSGWKLRE